MAKKTATSAKKGGGRSPISLALLLAAAVGIVFLLQWYLSANAPTPKSQGQQGSQRPPPKTAARRAASEIAEQRGESAGTDGARDYSGHEWTGLQRDLEWCLGSQDELMTVPVEWPGFHALCIQQVEGAASVSVLLHARSARFSDADGAPILPAGPQSTRVLTAVPKDSQGLVEALVAALQAELAAGEFRPVDKMISGSDYDFEPNAWRVFTTFGGPVTSSADVSFLGGGAAVWLFTGGQFLWPGVRLGHVTNVPIPNIVRENEHAEEKLVEMTTVSLRPTVFVLSGFLSDAECDFIKGYAASRMVPSGLAVMDSSNPHEKDVRTSTQTFMERGGSPRIRALEQRAHNLTRLPYENGENIQVVRYEIGQKYGAHRDFFNPNDYHKQPSMLRMVDYGARNRLATVFWYLEDVEEGGETFFPRALNSEGHEYKPWNGDHEDCYRGLAVKAVRGNAVLFYSMVPDGRLDERALHGGCKPRGEGVEKWGANQWIWNHPQRSSFFSTVPQRKGAPPQAAQALGCTDDSEDCAAWAQSGECVKNMAYMHKSCRASCNAC